MWHRMTAGDEESADDSAGGFYAAPVFGNQSHGEEQDSCTPVGQLPQHSVALLLPNGDASSCILQPATGMDVRGVHFCRAGSLLAVCGGCFQVCFYEVGPTGAFTAAVDEPVMVCHSTCSRVEDICVSVDGRLTLLAAAHSSHISLRDLDLLDNECDDVSTEIQNHPEDRACTGYTSCIFSPDSALLVTCGSKKVRLWCVCGAKWVLTLKGHTALVNRVRCAPNTNDLIVATASDDADVRLWRIGQTGGVVRVVSSTRLRGHTQSVQDVSFSHDSLLAASASHDSTVRVWSVLSGAEVLRFGGSAIGDPMETIAFSGAGTVGMSESLLQQREES